MNRIVRMFIGTIAAMLVAANPVLARDGDVIARGEIQALSSSIITVNGIDFALTPGTEYEDLNDNPTTLAAFSVGALVKVKGRGTNASGMLIAHEVELEDEQNDDNSGSGDDNSNGGSDDDNSSGGGSSGGGWDRTRIRGLLEAIPGVTTTARGNVKRDFRTRSDRTRDRITGKVLIPIPSTVPAAADATAAQSLVLTLVLSRAGVPYAQCGFEFDEVETNDSLGLVAEYKLDQRSRVRTGRNRFDSKKGFCDIDLVTADVQAGIPDIQPGDTAVVRDESVPVDFLQGSL